MIRHELARRLGPEAVIIANGVAIREYTEIATGWMDDQSYGSDFYNETCGLYCGIDTFFYPFLSSSTSASTWGLTRFRIRPLASSKRRDRRVPRRALLDVSRSSAYLNTCLVLCFRRSCPNWGRRWGKPCVLAYHTPWTGSRQSFAEGLAAFLIALQPYQYFATGAPWSGGGNGSADNNPWAPGLGADVW